MPESQKPYVTKRLRNGQVLTIVAYHSNTTAEVRDEHGARVASGSICERHPSVDVPDEYTHRIGPVYLTDEETDRVRAVLAAYEPGPPAELTPRQLRKELAHAYTNAVLNEREAWNEAMDDEFSSPTFHGDTAALAVEAAAKALDEFDQAHPELVAELLAEKDAQVREHFWE